MKAIVPLLTVALLALAPLGCEVAIDTMDDSDPADPNDPKDPNDPNPGEEEQPPEHLDYFEDLAAGDAQRELTCSRGNDDRFARWYCDPAGAPSITGLEDLLVGLGLKDPANPNQMLFAITAHSSSLVTRRTTSLNPRAVIFTDQEPDYLALGFVRGDGLAEIAAFDEARGDINFYLVRFDKACEPDCDNFQRYSPANETGWEQVTVYGDADIHNTALDCLQCHQPEGADTPRILRMQELQDPWTHWFRDNRGTNALLQDFLNSRPGEDYAGIPADRIADSDPADLEDFVRDGGFDLQPNEFLGDDINNDDIDTTDPNGEWMGLYNNAVAGTVISPPYFGISPFDPAKVASASAAYRAIADGQAGPETMPDMTELFQDSALAYLGFAPAEGLDATGIIAHKCGTCHDGRFPGITRDNFRIADFPDGLDREQKDKIIERINLGPTYNTRMPPVMFSDLSTDEIRAIEEALR